MNRNLMNLTGKFGGVLLMLPAMLLAHENGAPPRVTGAPGDQGTCLNSGCHTGTRTNDSPNLEILWGGGSNYQPGVKQTFTVRITDSARRYGFSASARLENNAINGQAGTFTNTSNATFVICDDNTDRTANGCRPTFPVEFITHSIASTSNTFTFDWTPPTNASAGAVVLYVAANASNGPQSAGAKIHLKSLRLQPGAAGGGVRPTISQGGIVQASAFGGGTTISPGSWIEIFGTDLATLTGTTTSLDWSSSFNNGVAPTNLGNTRVTIDGKPAFLSYVSASQVNAQVPDGIGTSGSVPVVVTTSAGDSTTVSVNAVPRSPAILAPAAFKTAAGRQLVVAEFPTSTPSNRVFAGAPNSIPGLNLQLPKPGDRLVIYGVGFGATNPALPAGTLVGVANSVPGVQITIGNAPATIEYAGLAPSAVGLYQFNIIVPNVQAGDNLISMSVGGVQTQANVYLTTGN